MIVIVAGSRTFRNFELLVRHCDHLLQNHRNDTTIYSGGAKGADKMAIEYAKLRNLPYKEFPAQWDRYGKSAGMRRNEEMATTAVVNDSKVGLVAFWDGVSAGTKNMIETGKKLGILVRIIQYKE